MPSLPQTLRDGLFLRDRGGQCYKLKATRHEDPYGEPLWDLYHYFNGQPKHSGYNAVQMTRKQLLDAGFTCVEQEKEERR